MRKNININTKGETDVKSSATMLRRSNMVDVSQADVSWSGKGGWDSFELIGTSNEEEGEQNEAPGDRARNEAFRKRLRASSVGRKIVSLSSLKLETA